MSNKTVFAKIVVSKLKEAIGNDGTKFNKGTPVLAQNAIAAAINEFVNSYVWSESTYTGVMNNNPSIADPVVKDDHKVMGACLPVGVPTSFESWVSSLEETVQSGFYCGPGKLGVTFATPFNPFGGKLNLSQDQLKRTHENNLDNPQLVVWEVVCQGIIDMLINNVTSGTSVASRPGQSTGVEPSTIIRNYIVKGPEDISEVLIWDIGYWDEYLWA